MLYIARFIRCLALVGVFGLWILPAYAEGGEAATSNEVQQTSRAASATLPKPIASLLAQGLEFYGTLDAPGELQGYALAYGNDPLAAYVLPNSDYVIVGTLLDIQGHDVMGSELRSAVLGPVLEATWKALESTRFIVDGADDAPYIMYTITDPNCPYCNALWKNTRPLVEQGLLQLRHILVGVLSNDSIRKAAAILESDDPADALEAHELSFQNGGIEPVNPSKKSRALLERHAQIMREAGATGTPTSFFRDEEGNVQRVIGAMTTDQIRNRMGIK